MDSYRQIKIGNDTLPLRIEIEMDRDPSRLPTSPNRE